MRTRTKLSGLAAMGATAVLMGSALGGQPGANATERHGLETESDYISVERKFDEESSTYYFLTRIDHRDEDGGLLRLEHAHAETLEGETVDVFAERMNDPLVAINASTMNSSDSGEVQARGVQIIDGEVVQDDDPGEGRYTLGVRGDNDLVSYGPQMRADAILADGAQDALTAFIPLIEEYEPVPEEVIEQVGHSYSPEPRQVIAQYDNGDLLIMSTGGRGFDGEGMTSPDLIRVLLANDVEFAFMLDGGGSTTTVVEGEQITPMIDNDGTENRLRPNFLFVRHVDPEAVCDQNEPAPMNEGRANEVRGASLHQCADL